MPGKATLQDLARAAGVSVPTVSRVATGSARVSPEVAKKVREAALKLGIDLSARNKTKVVGFLLGNRTILHPFHSRVLLGAETYCAAREYNLMFLSLRYDWNARWQDLHVPAILQRRDLVCGHILAGRNHPNLLELLTHRGIPFAVVGNNVIGPWRPEEYDVVWIEDVQGAYEMTCFLRSLGHRAIWFVGNCQLPWSARRYEGYCRAMSEGGLTPRVSEVDAEDHGEVGYLATKSILNRGEPVTAIFASDDATALGVSKALADCGLRIPQDVSVTGFNDVEAAMHHPPLTTVRAFPDQIGRQLAQMLLNRIARPDLAPQRYIVPTQLVKRESHQPLLPVPEPRSEAPKATDSIVAGEGAP